MKGFKNILVGFSVSFIGSIPLGYLNVFGFEIYTAFGIEELVLYLLGVIFVEAFVIYFTLIFANRLVNNKKLMKIIDILGILFLLVLAYSFYSLSSGTTVNHHYLEKYVSYSPFLIGLILSSLNFLQVPFWTGWNLYLINGDYIKTEKSLKFYYVVGTLIGTFSGMIALVYFLHSLSQNTENFSKYLMPVIIPVFFIVLASIQGCKVFKKYFR
ncbi:MAG TPA: hypothetical protein VIH09_00215 [Flavobacterium sp.]|uniref:hypothetical protein n=1 Tax=Flavobacterium sp. TaxID=239 RepID=UPI002F409B34